MLNSEDILEQEAATEALWSLSFDPSICKLLSTNEKALSSLRHLQSCGNKAVELSAKGTMWMLRQVRKSIEDEGSVDSKSKLMQTVLRWLISPSEQKNIIGMSVIYFHISAF